MTTDFKYWPTLGILIVSAVLASQWSTVQGQEEVRKAVASGQGGFMIPSLDQEEKRSWKQLQGSWGKRAQGDETNEDKRSWKQLQGSWGKRAEEPEWSYDDDALEEFSKRGGWSNLQGSWGKRSDELHPLLLRTIARNLLDSADISSEGLDTVMDARPLKRTWAKFAGSWGKRPHASRAVSPRSTNWSSLRGSWGKRGNNWGQLRGVWGKREAQD